MTTGAPLAEETPETEHLDVLIIGAGVSGIGSAWQLQQQLPGASYAILEAMETFGGTWVTHRYPGIRSDSDLYTYGYSFKPWTGPPIATSAEIKAYLAEIVAESGIDRHIRYGHTVIAADWSSEEALWTVTVRHNGETRRLTCSFLWMCQGYYRHAEGYTPDWPGMADFKGTIVHPQTWPEDIDLTDKRVVIIGSGATAATLLPSIAGTAQHVTMLQRSPTYFRTGRNALDVVEMLKPLDLDPAWLHEIARRKILADQSLFARMSVEQPDHVKTELIGAIRALLGPDYDVDTHFTPTYRPWRQRIAFVPDADLFEAIKTGKASVVTDRIERFEAGGIRLASGDLLEADVIVTATGFHLSVLGDIPFTLDGKPLNLADTVTYRGMMFTGVPNLVWVFGYFRYSWTLRTDLVSDFVCRMVMHAVNKGARSVKVELRPSDRDMALGPWNDPEDFNPGYLMRDMHILPKTGPTPEWRHSQDYMQDKADFPAIDLDDEVFVYR